MVCFCFLVDQKRRIWQSKPMCTSTRFCYIPFYTKSWKAIFCSFCGAILKPYT
ncbi:unnamed protein product [Withania somnifera]